MRSDTINALEILEAEGCTCVLCRDEQVYTTRLRGVRPLLEWLESGTELEGFCAADKVVGKAAAFLYCLLGVKEVYARVISQGALTVLRSCAVEVRYETLVPHIINRRGDGVCPFEAAVAEISEPGTALTAIRQKMRQMQP